MLQSIVEIRCVLKTGGVYTSEYVMRLQKAVQNNLNIKHSFVCLTDDSTIDFCETIPLKYKWEGWWSKIELFRPDLKRIPCLYFDLDTVLIACIDQLAIQAIKHKFIALRGFNQRFAKKGHVNFASGILAGRFWKYSNVYHEFSLAPKQHIAQPRENWMHGDQGFIADQIGVDKVPRLQNYLPENYIVGKRIINKSNCIPKNAKVIAWSGDPRLHTLHTSKDNILKTINKYWRQYE